MKCYINNPRNGATLPWNLDKVNTMFYPEQSMTTYEMHTSSRPKDLNIVTDCPDLVALYEAENVFVWRDGKWKSCEELRFNPYATSLSLIRSELFGIEHTIPVALVDGSKVTNCMGRNRR